MPGISKHANVEPWRGRHRVISDDQIGALTTEADQRSPVVPGPRDETAVVRYSISPHHTASIIHGVGDGLQERTDHRGRGAPNSIGSTAPTLFSVSLK